MDVIKKVSNKIDTNIVNNKTNVIEKNNLSSPKSNHVPQEDIMIKPKYDVDNSNGTSQMRKETIEKQIQQNYNKSLNNNIPESGVIEPININFSRIATNAKDVQTGKFMTVKHPEYWGDRGNLNYKIKDNVVHIYEGDTILGFTDLEGINPKDDEKLGMRIFKQKKDKKIVYEVNKKIEKPASQLGENLRPLDIPESPDIKIPRIMDATKQVSPNAKIIDVPKDIRQSGIIRNYTNYSYYYGQWSKGTAQRTLSEVWNELGRTNHRGIATINNRYLVAMSPMFGKVGDNVNVVLEDGTIIPCTIADAKGKDAKSNYGHIMGNGSVDIIEWESFGSKEDINIDDWKNKKVASVINLNSEKV